MIDVCPCVTRSFLIFSLGTAALSLFGAAALAQGRHDTSLPIEITADRLDVLRDQQVATFTGNVDAVQGDLVLNADELRVHYSGQDSAGPTAGTGGSIRRIEAFGNVFLTSPRETAQGEVGVYDVAEETITLEGDVVLTREENVIEGERLELDLATGRSRVLAGVPSTEGGQPRERVRAIFVPEGGAPSAQETSGQGDDETAGQGDDQTARPEPTLPSPAPPRPKLRPEG